MAEYLPGTIGERITELREGAGLTIEELAVKIGVNATTLGRMEKGQTQKIGDDVLTALAREFHVSTDFLLGLTSIPDRKNYDIAELGLSAQAARNLYTRKVNADVVNRLLEHPRFATLTAMIEHYLDDTFAAAAFFWASGRTTRSRARRQEMRPMLSAWRKCRFARRS